MPAQVQRGVPGIRASRKVLGLFFCGHPAIARELEEAVEQLSCSRAGQPGAPVIMYGSETVFG